MFHNVYSLRTGNTPCLGVNQHQSTISMANSPFWDFQTFGRLEDPLGAPKITSSRLGHALHSAVRLTVVGFSGNFV